MPVSLQVIIWLPTSKSPRSPLPLIPQDEYATYAASSLQMDLPHPSICPDLAQQVFNISMALFLKGPRCMLPTVELAA